MDDYYGGGVSDDLASDRRASGGGATCAGRGPWKHDGKVAGRYSCWFSEVDTDARESSREFAHLLFTVDAERIVGSGGAPAGRVKALLAWWADDARPG
jgi:hypothetical protein